jgi:hypothetical protein
MDFYHQAGLTDEQLQRVGALGVGSFMVSILGFYAVLYLGYLLYARRYFKSQPQPTPPA